MASRFDDVEAQQRAQAEALASRDPKTLDEIELAALTGYYRAGIIGRAPKIEARANPLPIAARIAADPERTVYGKMWETDLDAIERKPFIEWSWLSRTRAVIAKFRPRELRDEISAASLTTLSVGMAQLWREGKGVCHHSWSYIARRCGLCRDTVRLGLAWLRRYGLLVGSNVLVRPDGATTGPEERVANLYFPKLPEEGPPELALPTPESPAAKATVIERVKAEIGFIAGFCRDAVVTAWGINIRRASSRGGSRPAPT